MEVKFEVHNPHSTNMFVHAPIDGEMIPAEMRIFEVELKTLDGISGTLKLRFKGAAANTAKSLFLEGAAITASFAATIQDNAAA